MFKPIHLQAGHFYIVDADSGTILGTNVVAVPCERFAGGEHSDSEAIHIAEKYGHTLYTNIAP